MHLDKTRIVIRERSLPELLDLSLQVMRVYAVPLLLSVAALAVPLMLLNFLLIGWMAWEEYEAPSIARYEWTMAQLVFIEAPLATILATLYLGKVMFCEQPTVRTLAQDALSLFPRIFVGQILLRGVLVAWLLAASISRNEELAPAEIFLPLVCFVIVFLRSSRPYVNEIILLERNPYRPAAGSPITISRRMSKLHGPNSGDLFGRWLGSAPVALLLTCALVATCWFLIGTFSNDWDWGPVLVHLVVPLSMWVIATYMTVVRFLSYLDLRIRREGWEVELKIRAEAARISNQFA